MRLGPLRHKLRIEEQSQTQDGTTGAITVAWETVATVYGAIEPLSVRNFLAADAVQSKIEANKAMADKDYELASEMANQAQADANLAQAKADSAKAKMAADALQDDIRVLREELKRSRK